MYSGFIFLLLQIVRCIMATVRTASVPPWTRSRALGKASLVNLSLMILWDCDHELAPYLNNDNRCWFQTLIASATILPELDL